MIEVIKAATYIYFRGKDQGLTFEMLKRIGTLGGTKVCEYDIRSAVEEAYPDTEAKNPDTEEVLKRIDFREKLIESRVLEACSKKENYGHSFGICLDGYGEHGYWYDFFTTERQASSEEVHYLIHEIRKICGGIELEFDVIQYVFPGQFN